MDIGGGGWQNPLAFIWNLHHLNIIKIRTWDVKKFWKFCHRSTMCSFEGSPQVKCRLVTEFLRLAPAQHFGGKAAGATARPWPLWYSSIQQVLCSGCIPHTQPSSYIPSLYSSLNFCLLLFPLHWCTQDRPFQSKVHSLSEAILHLASYIFLTSYILLKDPGLRAGEQENGNTLQIH